MPSRAGSTAVAVLAARPGISVTPLSLQVIGPRPRLVLSMLAGAVFLVLLIARPTSQASRCSQRHREREIAVRAALGASHSRIVRQLLAESLTSGRLLGLLGLLLPWRQSASSWP